MIKSAGGYDDNIIAKESTKAEHILEKIKVEGNVDEGQKVIIRYETATLKWKGFESRMAIWNRIYERV
ncbi:MAG: hypothetical protein ABSG44_14295 [Thermodesulfobacteriota bacterium]